MKFFILFYLSQLIISSKLKTTEKFERHLSETNEDQQENEETLKPVQKKYNCKKELLISYGLEGLLEASTVEHKYCPQIQVNCCSNDDIERSQFLWENQYRYYIERYYETYLYSIKYLLGYSAEAYYLAQKQENSHDQTCKKAATDMISMNLNPRITERIYQDMKEAVKKSSDIRKGFYCIICDANNQDEFLEFWENTNQLSNDRLYFSKQFCQKLVSQNIKSSFNLIIYFKRYLENLNVLMNCVTKSNQLVYYEISIEKKTEIRNCYYYNKKYFFFFCEKYCENFDLTKPDPIFDGDIFQLRKFVDMIMENRYQAFAYPNNNILTDGVGFEENLLQFNYGEVFKDLVFFRPTTQQVLLDKFRSDFLYQGGVDPSLSIENNKFFFNLNSQGILQIWPLIVLAYTAFINQIQQFNIFIFFQFFYLKIKIIKIINYQEPKMFTNKSDTPLKFQSKCFLVT